MSAADALSLCFEVGPDGEQRIPDGPLARCVHAPQAKVRELIERDLLDDDVLDGVLVVERADGHREYHLTQLGALYVAGRIGTPQGGRVLFETITRVSSLSSSARNALGGDDSPLFRICEMVERGGRA